MGVHVTVYEGHAHYVMMCKFKPRDPTRSRATRPSIKVRALRRRASVLRAARLDSSRAARRRSRPRGSRRAGVGHRRRGAALSLDGHERGVELRRLLPGRRQAVPHLGRRTKTAHLDYQTKACVQTLEGHRTTCARASSTRGCPSSARRRGRHRPHLARDDIPRRDDAHYGMERVASPRPRRQGANCTCCLCVCVCCRAHAAGAPAVRAVSRARALTPRRTAAHRSRSGTTTARS